MKGFLGYERRPGDLEPPLGGPWAEDFDKVFCAYRVELIQGIRDHEHLYHRNPARVAAEAQWRAISPLYSTWGRTRNVSSPAGYGAFEVQLLSAVLVPGAYGFQPEEAETGRKPEEFRDDLRAASKVLALYTGADEGEIFTLADSQTDLMDYLGVVAMLPR